MHPWGEDGPVARAADFCGEGMSDNDIIDACLSFVAGFPARTIVLDHRDWQLDRAILLPAHTTVIVDGVTLKQKDRTFDNIFRGDNFVIDPADPNGYPAEVRPITGIRILGRNGAALEGPDTLRRMMHPVLGEEQDMAGDYWGWRNLQVCLSRCTGFELSGLMYRKQRGWANSFDRCSHGLISGLRFESDVKNGDGVNLRLGCSHIVIRDIEGTMSDDLVALNSGDSFVTYPILKYVYPMVPSNRLMAQGEDIRMRDIHDITISDIRTRIAPGWDSHGVALLSRNGHRIYNVYMDDIVDGHPAGACDRRVIVGSYKGYGSGYQPGDMHHTRINRVVSNNARSAVVLNDAVRDVWINRAEQNRPDGVLLEAVNPEAVTVTNSAGGPAA